MRKILLLVPVCLLFFCSIAHASSDHLWINQIQTTGGPGLTINDFVEIYNPTADPVNLNGYRLVKRTKTGTTDTLLKSWTEDTWVGPNDFYLWANSAFTSIIVAPDTSTTGTISDDNGVALRFGPTDTGTIIDSAAWGSSTNIFVEGSVFPSNPVAGQVIVRTADTDSNAADFSIAASNPHKSTYIAPDPTPTPPPAPPPPGPTPPPPPVDPTPPPPPPVSSGGSSSITYSGAILISEFLPNPDGADSGAEWVELYNNSSSDVDLSGWYLDDEGNTGTVGSSAYTFSSPSIISAKSFKVIDLPDGVFALDNTGGDALRLIWPNKITTQQVAYTDPAPTDTSYARKSDGTFIWTTVITKAADNLFVAPVLAKVSDAKTADSVPKSETSVSINRPIILISELFPEPDRNSDQDEFIELFNPTNKDIDLTGLKIGDLVTQYKLIGTIPANGFFLISKSDSNISLNNSGVETVTLTDLAGDMLATVSYTDAPSEQSYNLMPDGSFLWSSELTPGMVNKIAKAQVLIAVAATRSKTTSSVKTASVDTESNFDTEVATASSLTPLGQIAGADTSQIAATTNQNSFWPWLTASFAANLLFSYILVKLMSKARS